MKTLAFAAFKGGVGKTSAAVNVAWLLSAVHGKSVLVIDCDAQGNTSKMFGIRDGYILSSGLTSVLTGKATIQSVLNILPSNYSSEHHGRRFEIIPADMRLIAADRSHIKYTVLSDALNAVRETYDYCVIDCAPQFIPSVINALTAADEVFVPILHDSFALGSLLDMAHQIRNIRKNEHFHVNAFVNQYTKSRLSRDTILPNEHDGVHMMGATIRRTVKVSESTFAGKPLELFSPRCTAAQDYRTLTTEILGILWGVNNG